MIQPAPINRLERRKARTRAALIQAAQGFIAAGNPNVPILDITQAATLLNWQPATPLADGLVRNIAFFDNLLSKDEEALGYGRKTSPKL